MTSKRIPIKLTLPTQNSRVPMTGPQEPSCLLSPKCLIHSLHHSQTDSLRLENTHILLLTQLPHTFSSIPLEDVSPILCIALLYLCLYLIFHNISHPQKSFPDYLVSPPFSNTLPRFIVHITP